MTRILFLVFLLLAPQASAQPVPQASAQPVKFSELLERSAVKTSHTVPGPGYTTTQGGSGTIIHVSGDHFLVLSCAHVVEHRGVMAGGDLKVTTHDGTSHPAELLYWSTSRDLSLIRVATTRDHGLLAAQIADSESFAPGTRLVKCGFPGHGSLDFSVGECLPVKSYRDDACTIPVLVCSVRGRSGDSGGGIFRRGDRKLVAVLYGGSPPHTHGVRLPDIQMLLRVANKRNKLIPEQLVKKYSFPAAYEATCPGNCDCGCQDGAPCRCKTKPAQAKPVKVLVPCSS